MCLHMICLTTLGSDELPKMNLKRLTSVSTALYSSLERPIFLAGPQDTELVS